MREYLLSADSADFIYPFNSTLGRAIQITLPKSLIKKT